MAGTSRSFGYVHACIRLAAYVDIFKCTQNSLEVAPLGLCGTGTPTLLRAHARS